MSDHPTSAQYALGVEIGKLIKAEMDRGMSYDEVISTLRNTLGLIETNRDLDQRATLHKELDALQREGHFG